MPTARAAPRKRLLAATTAAAAPASSGRVAQVGSRWPRWTSMVTTAGRIVSSPRLMVMMPPALTRPLADRLPLEQIEADVLDQQADDPDDHHAGQHDVAAELPAGVVDHPAQAGGGADHLGADDDPPAHPVGQPQAGQDERQRGGNEDPP